MIGWKLPQNCIAFLYNFLPKWMNDLLFNFLLVLREKLEAHLVLLFDDIADF